MGVSDKVRIFLYPDDLPIAFDEPILFEKMRAAIRAPFILMKDPFPIVRVYAFCPDI